MKSINELYQEVKSDEELMNKFLAAYGKGEIEGFLKENGCDSTPEDVQQFIDQELHSESRELSDEELALVAGGRKHGSNNTPKYKEGQHVEYFVDETNRSGSIECEGVIIAYKGTGGLLEEHMYEIRRRDSNYNPPRHDIVDEGHIYYSVD